MYCDVGIPTRITMSTQVNAFVFTLILFNIGAKHKYLLGKKLTVSKTKKKCKMFGVFF